MSDDTAPAPANIPWYKSNIYRGLLITLLTQVLAAFKVTSALTPEAAPIADALLEVVSAVGVAWAAYSRAKHPLPNVTTTKKQADAANAAAATTTMQPQPGETVK